MSSQTISEVARSATGVIEKLPILILMTHSRCNCRCVMCDIWRTAETRTLSLTDLDQHLGSIRRLGVEWVVFSGGEPLMNPGLFPLAAALRQTGIRLTLLTTGLLIAKYAEEISSSMNEVVVSLDGPPEIHNRIRQVPRAFEIMRAGLARLRELSPSLPVRGRTTVQKDNHLYLRATVDAARELKLSSISFLAADISSTAFNRELVWPTNLEEKIGLTQGEIVALELEMQNLIRDYGREVDSGFIVESPAKLLRIVHQFRVQLGLAEAVAPICNAPWISAVIETDGRVRPCFFHKAMGNIRDGKLEDVVNSHSALKFRSGLQVATNPTCKRCVCSLNYV